MKDIFSLHSISKNFAKPCLAKGSENQLQVTSLKLQEIHRMKMLASKARQQLLSLATCHLLLN
jgi:hypothetical protein